MSMSGDDTSVLYGAGDHGPDQWRRATALFGDAGWDTGTLAGARVAHAEDDADAAAALAGAGTALRRLGEAGVVAIRAAGTVYELHETVDGWCLEATAGTPDVASLAMTAVVTATQMESERRAGRVEG
ncbi:MAG: hypothetical protein M3083_15400 [Actinomycetota bacterium]|nr:hypothetical protein [Actinomycetota bacterium]